MGSAMDRISYGRHEFLDLVEIQIEPGTQTATLHFQAEGSDALLVTIPLAQLVDLLADIGRRLKREPQIFAPAKEQN
jgi:hypothetical protein